MTRTLAPTLLLPLLSSVALAQGPGDLYVAGTDGMVYAGNAVNGDFEPLFLVGFEVTALTIDGHDLFAGTTSGLVLHHDLDSAQTLYAYSSPGPVEALTMDSAFVFAGGPDGFVHRFSRVNGDFISSIPIGEAVVGLDNDAGQLFAATSSGEVFQVDLATDTVSSWASVSENLSTLQKDPTWIYTSTAAGGLLRINALVQEPPTQLNVPGPVITATHHHGTHVLTLDSLGVIRRVDGATGLLLDDEVAVAPPGTQTMIVNVATVGTPGQSVCTSSAALCPCGNDDPGAGCANSTGGGARLEAVGSPSVAADDAYLYATQLPPNQFALPYTGTASVQVPFGDGIRCIGAAGGLWRLGVQATGPEGWVELGLGIVSEGPAPIAAGSSWDFQVWYRDPGGPCGSGFNLSGAYRIAFAQ